MTGLPTGLTQTLTVAGHRLGWAAVRRMPERAAYALFEAAADLTVARGGAARMRANYARVRPELDDAALDALVKEGMRRYLRYYCEAFRLPVLGNGLGRGLVPEDWERSFNWPMAQIAAHRADVVLVVGARLKQRLGFGLPPRFSPAAKFIQVDIEAEELGRNRRIDVPVVGDAGLFCDALAAALAARGYAGPPKKEWLRAALHERIKYLLALASTNADPIHPLRLGRAIMERLEPDDIIVGDGADVQNWMYGALRVRRAPGFLDHYPLGGMGIGTPLAVGAAAAARELAGDAGRPRRVVLVTGDGSIGFYPAELHAAALAGLPLVVVVCNDGAWGTELHGQRKAIGRSVNTELGSLPYERLGEAFGGRGLRVERAAELGPALDAAFLADVPCVVNVLVDREAGAAIKSDPRAALIMFDDLPNGLGTLNACGGPRE